MLVQSIENKCHWSCEIGCSLILLLRILYDLQEPLLRYTPSVSIYTCRSHKLSMLEDQVPTTAYVCISLLPTELRSGSGLWALSQDARSGFGFCSGAGKSSASGSGSSSASWLRAKLRQSKTPATTTFYSHLNSTHSGSGDGSLPHSNRQVHPDGIEFWESLSRIQLLLFFENWFCSQALPPIPVSGLPL